MWNWIIRNRTFVIETVLMLNWILWIRTVLLNWIAGNRNIFDNETVYLSKTELFEKEQIICIKITYKGWYAIKT